MVRLKELRNKFDKSQADMAEMMGITQQAYSNYEAGRREPDYKALTKLANFFNVTTDYLLGNNDNPMPLNKETMPTGIYFRLAKEAEALGLDEEDVENILKIYRKHEERNK